LSAWKKQINADSYIDGVRAAIPLIDEQVALMHRLINATLPAIENVLDLGCGDGALAASVLARHQDASAVLVDFSEPMLARAQERFDGNDAAAVLVHADFCERTWIDRLPDARPYDLVISGYAIHHLDDERKLLLFRDIYRLLRPGGLFLNLEHVAPVSCLGHELFDELFINSLFDQAIRQDPAVRRTAVAAQYHGREDQHDNRLAPVDEQCRWLREIGFIDVDCYFKFLALALLAGRKPD